MIISVVSGKGGVGKTTTVANLGIALQRLGKKVCAVDANITTSNLGLHLGIVHYPVTLHEVLKNRFPILDSLYIHESGLRVLPGSLSLENAKVSLDGLRRNLGILDKKFDYVLIDAAPGIEKEAMTAIEVSDEILVVTNPELPAVTDAIRVIELAKKSRKPVRGMVLNKVMGKRFEPLSSEIESVTNIPVIAEIPFDVNVLESIADKVPVAMGRSGSPAAKAFFWLAERITGNYAESGRLDFFARLKSILNIFFAGRVFADRKKSPAQQREKKKAEKSGQRGNAAAKKTASAPHEKEKFSDFEGELKKQILKKLKEREAVNKD